MDQWVKPINLKGGNVVSFIDVGVVIPLFPVKFIYV